MTRRTPLVVLLARARLAEVDVSRSDAGTLALRAPKNAVRLATQLRQREDDVLKLYDWTRARVAEPERCVLCRKPAHLRDPAEGEPCHKVCCDALLSQSNGAQPVPDLQWLADDDALGPSHARASAPETALAGSSVL